MYIDFARAFDSIVYSKLLHKLNLFGISGNVYSWIEKFLMGRTQCVIIDYVSSGVRDVISGVPQGSVMGPILFLLYINDIDSICHTDSTLKLFADDCKLYSVVTLNNTSTSLQLSLNNLCIWASVWQLTINVIKCYVLTVFNSRIAPSPHVYYINGLAVPTCTSNGDLGITMSHDLSYKAHINNIVARAYQRQSTLLRGFTTRNITVIRKAFITYVRPVLEYNSVIWSPTEIYLIDLIEKVQRRFSKCFPSLSSMTYTDRLSALKLEPLELRRLHFDLIHYYKILNNLTPLNPSDYFEIYHPPPSSRSSSSYLSVPRKASTKLLSSLFYRNIKAWNNLPPEIRYASSLFSFKSKLKSTNLNKYLKGSSFR